MIFYHTYCRPSIIHPALGNSLLSCQDLSRARTENRTWSLWTEQINSWLEARYLWSKKWCVPGIRVSRHRGMIKRFIYRGCWSWALQGCCRLLQAPSWHQSLQISNGEHGRGLSTQLTPASDNDFITGPRLWSAHAPGLCLGATMLGKW